MKQNNAACPIGCRYCVITQVGYRRCQWEQKFLIGMNKTVTILNPPPDKNDMNVMDSFYNFPLELLEADRVGFNAISDPFWQKYGPELDWFLEHVAPIVKVAACVTKMPVSESLMRVLATIKNFQLNVSITGLEIIENSTTRSRLKTLELAKKYGVKAFVIIHPYIAGMSDLSFLPKLKAIGYDCVDVKGLRYDPSMADWMPQAARKFYEGTEGKEVLPEDGWRKKIEVAGLQLKSLRQWTEENQQTEPRLSRNEAEKRVRKLLQYANITSSDKNAAVIQAAIERRL